MASKIQHEPLTDCFAYMEKCHRCSILNETFCKKEECCSFYKTKKQYEADRKKYDELAAARLHLKKEVV